jgi:hypothetical protein
MASVVTTLVVEIAGLLSAFSIWTASFWLLLSATTVSNIQPHNGEPRSASDG